MTITGPQPLLLEGTRKATGLLRPKKHHVKLSTPALQTQMADLLRFGSKPPRRWQMDTQVETEHQAPRSQGRGHSPQGHRQGSSAALWWPQIQRPSSCQPGGAHITTT